MDMAQKIKELRKERDMTLEEVGNIVGVGKSTVRKWENGDIENMRRDKIVKLAKALNCSPAYLMGYPETLDKVDTDSLVDSLSNPNLIEHIGKLKQLNTEHQQSVFDLIDCLSEKEGHS